MDELAYVVCGSVDSGKSTLIGTILSNKLDDGNGSNRAYVSAHKHEIKSGKTSSIAVHSLKKYQDNKSLVLIDLCGHEKYLKTTLYGIMGYYPDYAIVIIGGNRGILKMTREHVKILHHLKIPIILVITKTDIIDKIYEGSEENGLDKMKNEIVKTFYKGGYNVIDMNQSKDVNEIIPSTNTIPLFGLSCKTGYGLDSFKKYISNLPKKQEIKLEMIVSIPASISQKKKLDDYIFYIEKVYCPPGIGWVVTGIVKCINPEGYISANTFSYLGPNNDVTQLKIWSMHNYYQEKIDKLYNGQRGCIALRSEKKISYESFRKGTILTNNLDILKKATYKYKAEIKLLSHPSNVRDNFSPVIHCATIRQTASIKIIEIKAKVKKEDDGNCIYPGDTAIIQIEFKFKPEIIEPKQSFFLREGLTLGVGTILEPVY
jgi:elongation factor 1-alpha